MFYVYIPRQGVNDDKAIIVRWLVTDKEKIRLNQVICEVETTKAVFDVECQYEGYIRIIAPQGKAVALNEHVAIIVDHPDREIPLQDINRPSDQVEKAEQAVDHEGKFTKQAYEYAVKNNFNIKTIHKGGIITVKDVKEALDNSQANAVLKPVKTDRFDESRLGKTWGIPIAIYGTGLGARTVTEYIQEQKIYEPVCYINDFDPLDEFEGRPVMSWEQLLFFREKIAGVACFVADNNFRLQIGARLERYGLQWVSIIAQDACVKKSARLGRGVLIKSGAVVGTDCQVGNGCVIDNNVTVAHHCVLEDGVFLAPGVSMGGGVKMGAQSIAAVGAHIASTVTIGDHVIISVGTSVHFDIPADCIVEGSPGKIIGKRKK